MDPINTYRFSRSFNGAALKRARRYGWNSQAFDFQRFLLQRGRAQTSAEIRRGRTASRGTFKSLQRGRAQTSAEMRRQTSRAISRPGSFNGAALNRARRFDGIRTTRLRRHLASTGPRSNERGDHPPMRPCGSGRYQASTGPRSNERGDRKEYVVEYSRDGASTGPRSNERGDAVTGPRGESESGDASTGPRSNERGDKSISGLKPIQMFSFNGAALKRARRLVMLAVANSINKARLQRGRAQTSAEIRYMGGQRDGQEAGFNGAALKRARRLTPLVRTVSRSRRFNGAALKRARRFGVHRSEG